MIRVTTLDRHPAVRAGIDAILRAQPDIAPVGAAADRHELWPLLYRTDPDVVLLGQPSRGDRLGLCLRIHARLPRTRVIVYAADAGIDAIVPATFAGAHGIIDKAAAVGELLDAIRAVGRDEPAMPAITPSLQRRAAARLQPQDRAILAMRLAGTTSDEIATTIGLRPRDLQARSEAILAELGGHAAAQPPDRQQPAA
jgi:DNA-binding NarL/FixJ family response regulator